MADIYFYQGDTDEESEGGESSSSNTNQDDGLSPVEKLVKYADSENIFNRQMVARTVLETLRQVAEPASPEPVEEGGSLRSGVGPLEWCNADDDDDDAQPFTRVP